MVGVALDVFLDVDVRMRRLVLLVEVVVAEVAEQADVQRDRVLLAARGRAREATAHGEQPHRDDCNCDELAATPVAPPACFRVHLILLVETATGPPPLPPRRRARKPDLSAPPSVPRSRR